MADVRKYTHDEVLMMLRHIERTVQNPSNTDINQEFTPLNYSFIERDISAFDWYLKRKNELKCYNRADVKTCLSWVVTAPKDLPTQYNEKFFECVHSFLLERYPECIQSVVHYDESTPHLHFLAIPVVKSEKVEKVCMCQVINRAELRNFHPALQAYLKEKFKDDEITPNVMSGITKLQGGNRSVLEMKRARELEHTYEHEITREVMREW